jgi:hypothetical protein
MKKKIRITLEQLEEAIRDQAEQWDFDELSTIAGDWFGGKCEWESGDSFIFTPDEYYQGAFDHLKKS